MDISALSNQYLNSEYIPFSSTSVPEVESGTTSGFDKLLKKAQEQDFSNTSFSSVKKTPIDKTDKLYEACMELETFLIKNLIKSMRSTVQKNSLIDTGFAGEVYEDMLYDEYAKAFARNANFGFAEMAYRELAGMR
jgi:peptidoglycan hydrolase FlgJ